MESKSPQFESLNRKDLDNEPLQQFETWFREAEANSNMRYPNACTLSTVDGDGWPNSRIVLLKHYGPDGLGFFTNCNSVKGQALLKTEKAALTFFWDSLGRQVRARGEVNKLSEESSDNYFNSRPRDAQIGAWASKQSEILGSRQELELRVEYYTKRFEGSEVARPPHWSGFLLVPEQIEFWQEREARLHDRFIYKHNANGGWDLTRLYP